MMAQEEVNARIEKMRAMFLYPTHTTMQANRLRLAMDGLRKAVLAEELRNEPSQAIREELVRASG